MSDFIMFGLFKLNNRAVDTNGALISWSHGTFINILTILVNDSKNNPTLGFGGK